MKTMIMIQPYSTEPAKTRMLGLLVPKNDEMLREAIKITKSENERIRNGTWPSKQRGCGVYEIVDLSQQEIMQITRAMKRISSMHKKFGSRKSRFGISVAVYDPVLDVNYEELRKSLAERLIGRGPVETIFEILLMFTKDRDVSGGQDE